MFNKQLIVSLLCALILYISLDIKESGLTFSEYVDNHISKIQVSAVGGLLVYLFLNKKMDNLSTLPQQQPLYDIMSNN